MTKTFTQKDLIRYIYHETSEKETKEIHKALLCDSELLDQFKELIASKNHLDLTRLQPSATTIANILGYSKSFEEKKV